MYLPSEITNHIKDMLWGNREEWKAKFSKIVEVLPHSIGKCKSFHENLSTKTYKIYCPLCGEYKLSIFGPVCEYCNDFVYKQWQQRIRRLQTLPPVWQRNLDGSWRPLLPQGLIKFWEENDDY